MYDAATTGRPIFIVDDDPTWLSAVGYILRRAGWLPRTFNLAEAFIRATIDEPPVCVLVDVLMPDRSGLDVIADLKACGFAGPIVMMSGAGDIPMAVEAIRRGASNFLRKPSSSDEIVGAIIAAIKAQEEEDGPAATLVRSDFPGHALLTPREREILQHIASGETAKEAAQVLAISPRTVEFYRARIYQKLGAKNSADLMRIVLRAPH